MISGTAVRLHGMVGQAVSFEFSYGSDLPVARVAGVIRKVNLDADSVRLSDVWDSAGGGHRGGGGRMWSYWVDRIVPGSIRTLGDIRVEPPDWRPPGAMPEDFYSR